MRTVLLAMVCVSCTCPRAPVESPPSPWPEFPASLAAREALITEWTRRPVSASPEVTPERVFAEAERRGWHTLPAGDVQIREWLTKHPAKWMLFGTFHDAAGQVDAFRRLVGPGGVAFDHLALEQLRADGKWRSVASSQSGDSAALSRFLSSGDRGALDELSRAHEEHDYTAWKYGYAQDVLELITTARALNVPLSGCDLPDTLLAQLVGDAGVGATPQGTDEQVMRLRELHCFLALNSPKGRVAMLWGQAHLRADGFRRYVPANEKVLSVYAIGARHSADAPDELLRDRLILNEPVVVPLSDDEAALLLPDQWLGGKLERVRINDEGSAGLRVSTITPGTFTVSDQSVELGDVEVHLNVAPGSHTWSFSSGGVRVVGTVLMPQRGEVELSIDVPARSTRMVEVIN